MARYKAPKNPFLGQVTPSSAASDLLGMASPLALTRILPGTRVASPPVFTAEERLRQLNRIARWLEERTGPMAERIRRRVAPYAEIDFGDMQDIYRRWGE